MIVTFLYRIRDITYYGKYIGYITDDYDDGLDIEVQKIIYPYIKEYYHIADPSELSVGILSYQRTSYEFFSSDECKVFQLLICNFSNKDDKELYIHGTKHNLLM